MEVVNRANLSSDEIKQMQAEVGQHMTLNDVLSWAFKQPSGTVLPQVIADVVVQDEYSHDVIVPWRDGLVIVYSTT